MCADICYKPFDFVSLFAILWVVTTGGHMTTPEERLATYAAKMGTTVEAIKAHTQKVDRNQRDLWEAKQRGATDAELVAIATSR